MSTSTEHQSVLILDFGSQFTQLIARRVRENRVYCEVHPFDLPLEEIRRRQPIGLILSGGPQSVYEPGAATAKPELFDAVRLATTEPESCSIAKSPQTAAVGLQLLIDLRPAGRLVLR